MLGFGFARMCVCVGTVTAFSHRESLEKVERDLEEKLDQSGSIGSEEEQAESPTVV